MGSGEYISVRSQNESMQAELEVERRELKLNPQAELEELTQIYIDRGVDQELARLVAQQLSADPVQALEIHAQEELGVDIHDLPNPWMAAGSSFLSFSVGAVLPLLPFMFGGDLLWLAAVLTLLGLFVTGAITSRFTSRSWLYAGARQLAAGCGHLRRHLPDRPPDRRQHQLIRPGSPAGAGDASAAATAASSTRPAARPHLVVCGPARAAVWPASLTSAGVRAGGDQRLHAGHIAAAAAACSGGSAARAGRRRPARRRRSAATPARCAARPRPRAADTPPAGCGTARPPGRRRRAGSGRPRPGRSRQARCSGCQPSGLQSATTSARSRISRPAGRCRRRRPPRTPTARRRGRPAHRPAARARGTARSAPATRRPGRAAVSNSGRWSSRDRTSVTSPATTAATNG